MVWSILLLYCSSFSIDNEFSIAMLNIFDNLDFLAILI